jgi:hypothetical protein
MSNLIPLRHFKLHNQITFEIEENKFEIMDLEVEIKYIKYDFLLMLSNLMHRPFKNTLKFILKFILMIYERENTF